ncbi:MAG: DUF4332 domain-containing protein [Candidatus Thorarchaeota archaeon]|jgi:hypothetical protein
MPIKDEEGFRKFLKRGGRSKSVADRVIRFVDEFESYLKDHRKGKSLEEADTQDLEGFVLWFEEGTKKSANTQLWGLKYYFEFTSNDSLKNLAGKLREKKIKRTPFSLAKFRGVNQTYVKKLAKMGIKNVDHMLEAGKTPKNREDLAERSDVPIDAILEFVKLSDLTRLGAVKTIRARLYYDAGIDTVEKMAQWNPEDLRAYLLEWVERTGFKGIATLPKEAEHTTAAAKMLPKVIEY